MNVENMRAVLDALPDPAFLLSQSGKYVAIFGGRDSRYYHDGSSLVGQRISDVLNEDKTNWFLSQIHQALETGSMKIVEYELSDADVKGLPRTGPSEPIWFEGRIQPLSFKVEGEDVVLWVASNISKRHQLEEQLRYLSNTDQLTGLFNRRRLQEEMVRHFASFKRYQTPSSIFMLDLDNLKTINDSAGHKVGDEVIVNMANICKQELRETDIACRFGGDEFVILLPNTDNDEALQLAERLRTAFNEALTCDTEGFEHISVSIGVTGFKTHDSNHEEALHRADTILYRAKEQGKNQVIAS